MACFPFRPCPKTPRCIVLRLVSVCCAPNFSDFITATCPFFLYDPSATPAFLPPDRSQDEPTTSPFSKAKSTISTFPSSTTCNEEHQLLTPKFPLFRKDFNCQERNFRCRIFITITSENCVRVAPTYLTSLLLRHAITLFLAVTPLTFHSSLPYTIFSLHNSLFYLFIHFRQTGCSYHLERKRRFSFSDTRLHPPNWFPERLRHLLYYSGSH